MKKSKFQLMQKISTVLAIGLLMLQVALPTVIVFAEGTDQTTDTTAQMQEALQSSSESIPVTDSSATNETSTSQTTPTTEVTTESSTGAKESGDTADVASDEEDGEESDDPDPASTEEVADETTVAPAAKKSRAIGPQMDYPDFFTFEWFKYADELGNPGAEVPEGAEIEFGTEYLVQFKWDTEDKTIKSGDTATLKLPDVFETWEDVPSKPIIVAGIGEVGKYTVNDGYLVFTFNENIEAEEVSNGYASFALKFDKSKFEEDLNQEIDFDGDSKVDLNVKAKPAEVETKLKKSAKADKDVDATSITWTVDIVNGGTEKLTTGVLKDILPDGVGDPDNFKFYPLSYDIDGEETVGAEVSLGTPVINGKEFTLTVGEVPARGGYRVVYTTPITDYTKTSFTNNAEFTHDGDPLTGFATVDGIVRNNPIEKSGVVKKEDGVDYIDWTIVVNKNGQAIENAIVDDQLPECLEIVEGTIKVDKNGTVVANPTEFPITLGAVAKEDLYTITYRTKVDWSKVNEGQFQQTTTFENTATLHDGEKKIGEDLDKKTIDRGKLVQKSGNATGYTYENNKLNWSISVNKAGHSIGDAVLTDTIPAGLTITKDDITFKKANGDSFTPKSVTVVGNQVTIELGDIEEEIVVSYSTTVTDFSKDSFTNKAGLTGEGIGTGTHEDEKKVTPPANAYNKKFKDIDYENKTIEWELTVTPSREPITELTITDTFPNDGLVLLTDGFVVKHGDDTLTAGGSGYTLSPTDDGQNGFTLVIHPEITKTVTVTYKTSYNPDLVDVAAEKHKDGENEYNRYINKAHFEGKTKTGNTISLDKDAYIDVIDNAWNSGYKEGQLVGFTDNADNRKIAWQVYLNYHQQNLGSEVVVTDTLNYKGEAIDDSINVYVYKVAKDGTTTIDKTQKLTRGEDYEVTIENEILTVTFLKEVSERYVIDFQTTVPDISQTTYENDADVKVGDKTFPYHGSVGYDNGDKHLDKTSMTDTAYIGDDLEWQVTVNESLSLIENAKITDTISPGLTFQKDSLVVKTKDGVELKEGTDYTVGVTGIDGGETKVVISLKNTLKEMLTLTYSTIVTAISGKKVNNSVLLEGTGFEEGIKKDTDEKTARQFSWVGGTIREDRGAIKVMKVDSTGKLIETSKATFKLTRILGTEEFLMGTFDTSGGILEIPNLPLGEYKLQETAAPEGYRLSETPISVTVDKKYGKQKVFIEVKVTNISDAKTEISVTKDWQDAENQDGLRKDIEVALKANGKSTEFANVTLTEATEWKASFTGLPLLDESGNKIEYTVEEVEVPTGYTNSGTTGDAEKGFTITNSHTPSKTKVEVTKDWADNKDQDGIRPESVTVQLLADGEATGKEKILSAATEWKAVFADLDEFKAGSLIEYTVVEKAITGYTAEVTGSAKDGYIITNTHKPELITLSGEKTWDDADNQDGARPDSIYVYLKADGLVVDEQEVTPDEDGNWTYSFEGQPKFKAGKAIIYTVQEEQMKDYTPTYSANGLSITNSHTPAETYVEVTKTWSDSQNQDGIRPESVKVQLYADGEETDEFLVLDASVNWRGVFDGLDKFKSGEPIEYTVQEVSAGESKYEAVITGSQEKGYVIDNQYTPETTSISGTKHWDDDNNRDGKRPNSITVYLLVDNKRVRDEEGKYIKQEVTANDDGEWVFSFDNLPKRENGKIIDYSVEEVKVADYQQGYEFDGTIADIYNSYTPGLTSVSVRKAWQDSDNQDGIRPDAVTVQLLADGEVIQEQELNEENNWKFIFTDLDEYKQGEVGQLVNYTIEEVDVEGYESVVTPVDSDGEYNYNYQVTNSYTPEVIDLEGTKTWDDADNQDGKRPESITVNLYADDDEEPVRTVTVSEETNWTYTFETLPRFRDQGVEINYFAREVKDDNVAVYTPEYIEDGIINHYTPGKTFVDVVKVWNDKDDQDSLRPDEITVQLLADGKVIDEQKVTVAMNWRYIFTDLDEYKDGKLIEYSIKEVDVPEGYESSINGSAKEGFTITNTHKPTKPDKEKKPTKGQKYGKLPQTGENQGLMLMVLGLALILLTTSGYVVYKRKS